MSLVALVPKFSSQRQRQLQLFMSACEKETSPLSFAPHRCGRVWRNTSRQTFINFPQKSVNNMSVVYRTFELHMLLGPLRRLLSCATGEKCSVGRWEIFMRVPNIPFHSWRLTIRRTLVLRYFSREKACLESCLWLRLAMYRQALSWRYCQAF